MTPPSVSQAVSERKQDGNLIVRTLLLCSETKVSLLFVHDELQFKRSFRLKIGRYRLYIRGQANNMLLILSIIYQLVIQHATYMDRGQNVGCPGSRRHTPFLHGNSTLHLEFPAGNPAKNAGNLSYAWGIKV